MVDKKKYEKELHDEHYDKHIKRYSEKLSKIVYNYWDSEMISMLDVTQENVVLDYGCGIGTLTNKIPSRLVIGVDISKSLLKITKKKPNVHFVVGDGENLPFKNDTFDRVIGRGILHHLQNPNRGGNEIKRVVKANGKIVLSEPNDSNPFIQFIRRFLKVFESGYSKKQTYFNPRDFKELFGNSKLIYFGYLSFPFGFPDINKIKIPSLVVKFFIQIDKILTKAPVIKKLSWHIILAYNNQGCRHKEEKQFWDK